MNVKIGDRVRFLNDVGGGIVTEVIDRKNVMIESDTGFDVPCSVNELVVIDSTYNESEPVQNDNQTSNYQEEELDLESIFYPEVTEINENGNNINLHLAFVPQGRAGNSNLDLYLINDSNYNVLYNFIQKDDLGNTFSGGVGVLDANIKLQIDSLALQSVNQIPEYICQFLMYKRGDFSVQKPIVKNVKINPIKFYKEKAYIENYFFNENAIIIPLNNKKEDYNNTQLSDNEIKKLLKEKEQVDEKPQPISRKVKENEIKEIDLHINELLDDCRGLSNGEMLEIQLNKFQDELKQAVKQGPKKIVFIHGVGNGTLKTELRKELDKKKDKLTYHDASFKEYGYGATMVKIRG